MRQVLQGLSVVAAVFGGAAVSLPRMPAQQPEKRASFHVVLDNNEDVVYTGKMKLGESTLDLIPDTGSFEAVIFSDKCDGCGDAGHLYHSDASSTRVEGELLTDQFYGSGSVKSKEAYDDFEVGAKLTTKQVFWEVFEAKMPVLSASMLSGILGLGSPNSNMRMAQKAVGDVISQVDEMRKNGVNVSRYLPVIEEFKKKAEFAKTEKLWLLNVDLKTFSVCFGKEPGSPGYIKFNDGERLGYFKKSIDVVGDIYWSAQLVGVNLSGSNNGNVNMGHKFIGCRSSCNAILDTGTSLIAAPEEAYENVVNTVMEYFDNVSGGCSNLEHLPHMVFTFGGEQFSLPPHAYVGEVDSHYPKDLLQHMPHLDKFATRHSEGLWSASYEGTFCAPLVMSMGNEDMWILGMPFFRKYNTMFHLSDDSMNANKVFFAEAADFGGNHCVLGTGSGMDQVNAEPVKPTRVNGHKIITPGRHARQIRLED